MYEESGYPADTFLDGIMVHLDSLNARGGRFDSTSFWQLAEVTMKTHEGSFRP